MKQKASLVLMEQLLMILVFALAAVLCLRIFVQADGISRQTARQDRAVILAQNGAEAVKGSSGDWKQAAQILGATWTDSGIFLIQDDLSMEISRISGEVPGLGQAEITVLAEEEAIFSLTVAWQEVAP